MIFKRFLSPRSQRPGLPQDQEGLLAVVRSDADNALRREACRRIHRLPALREIAEADADAGVRELAMAHYRRLLCGGNGEIPTLAERLEELATLSDQRVVEQVANAAVEPQVRLAAIARVESPEALIACALHDALAANRSAAAERIADRAALERLLRSIGKRDKNVHRIARQRLKEIQEREALPARVRVQCVELCEKLERLGRFESWSQDLALLELIDRQWAEIEPNAEPESKARYQGLRERFLAAYESYRAEHAAEIAAQEARDALRQERTGLLDELATCVALTDEAELTQRQQDIQTRWTHLDRLPDAEQSALDHRYGVLSEQIAAHRKTLAEDRRRAARLRKLAQTAEKALTEGKPLEQKRTRALLDEAHQLLAAQPTDAALAEPLGALATQIEERLTKQRQHAEKRLGELPDKLDELEAAIEGGELKHAEPLYQSLLAGLELVQASGLPKARYEAEAARLHGLAPRVRDLQTWRKWGADQHRQALCEAMEELLAAELPLEVIHLRLHDLQMEWKGLDQSGSPVNHPLWERFHALSDQVYTRCKPYIEALAAEREANRRHREALCTQLEDFLDKVDWARMDWKKAARAEREMRQAWAAAGETEGRHRKGLEKRFHTAIKRLDERLSAERARNQAHKRDLITRLEALVGAPDLDRAIEETKQLQRQWHTTVPARQKDENRLWQQFRGACDAVFARRREQQEVATAELREHLRQREALCEEAERLAAAESCEDELAAALRGLEGRWRDGSALPLPRQGATAVAQRWREARSRLLRRIDELREQAKRESLALLERQASLCEGLERGIADTDAAEADWQALPAHRDDALQRAIAERFTAALATARAGGSALAERQAAFVANGERRAEICLRLEVLAGIDSPPEHREERLAFQVARLKDHMREGEGDPLQGGGRLFEEWYLCGPAPQEIAPALDARFARARAALEQSERKSEAA
jgi:hypothetical protein